MNESFVFLLVEKPTRPRGWVVLEEWSRGRVRKMR